MSKDTITKSTTISISLLCLIGSLIFYFGIEKNSSDVNAKEIDGIKKDQREYKSVVDDINMRLSRIEGALKIINR